MRHLGAQCWRKWEAVARNTKRLWLIHDHQRERCENSRLKGGEEKRNTCIESALMISPPYFTANSRASFDFPVPVAPHTTITGKREFKSLVVVLDNPTAAIFKTPKHDTHSGDNRRTHSATPRPFCLNHFFPFLLWAHQPFNLAKSPPKKFFLTVKK